MPPKNLAFGGGASGTMLHPLIAVWMLIAVVLILVLPRNKAIAPFLLSFYTIPFQQVILLGPLHFPVLRILILAAFARTLGAGGATSNRRFPGGFNRLDKVVILWTVSAFIVVSLRWMDPQALIKFIGDFLDSFCGYLAIRYLIPDREAVRRAVKVLALVCVIQGVCMMTEQYTHQNVFALFGENQPTVRDGHVRAEGVMGTLFGGAFAGVSIPLFLWLWTEKGSKKEAVAGLIGSTTMVMATHASTAWMGLGASIVGLCLWPIRRQMRFVRYGIVCTLVGLHLVMNGPVWSLIEKIDLTGGSSSYHRYMLVDNCIRHFSDWWLLGYKDYGSWGFDMWDLCNQFVVAALTGGLSTLILFIMIYSRSFGAIGKTVRCLKGDQGRAWLLWCLGSDLFGNVVASFGINYMIQLQVMLFVLIACTSIAVFKTEKAVVRTAEKWDNVVFASERKLA
jgi:hypothetical protein